MFFIQVKSFLFENHLNINQLQKEKSERDNNPMQENELKDNLRKKIDIYNNNLLQQSSVDISKLEQVVYFYSVLKILFNY